MTTIDENTLKLMAQGRWTPPIKRFDENAIRNADDNTDMHCGYNYEDVEAFKEHHEAETKLLLSTVEKLATDVREARNVIDHQRALLGDSGVVDPLATARRCIFELLDAAGGWQHFCETHGLTGKPYTDLAVLLETALGRCP